MTSASIFAARAADSASPARAADSASPARGRVAPAAFGAAVALAAASVPAAPAAAQTVTLPEVVVSGGLSPAPASSLGRSWSVVEGEEIRRRGIVRAADALRVVPGVSVGRTGGPGGTTQIRIRGAESNHVLVLIDGVEVSAPENGEYDFAGLLAEDIERIEVLRGPQSALYGGDALAGVIAITTRGADRPGRTVGGSVEGGSDGTKAGDLFVRWRGPGSSAAVSVTRRDAVGFDVSGTPGGEADGDTHTAVNLKGEVDVGDVATVGAAVRYTYRESEFDDFAFGAATRDALIVEAPNATVRDEAYGTLHARAALAGGRIESEARVAYLLAGSDNRVAGATTASNRTTRAKGTLRGTVGLDAPTPAAADHTLTLLGEIERETFENDDPALVIAPSQLELQARTTTSVAAEYRGEVGRLGLQAGVRHDAQDAFEDATTWSLGASFRVPETGSRLHASAGTGVQTPNFFEQFGFIPASFNGNPNLRPERSFGWDAGVEQSLFDDALIVDVTYFRQDLEDEIATVFLPSGVSTVVNSPGRSERQGVEVSLQASPVAALALEASWTWTDSRDAAGLQEARRPRHELAGAATLFTPDGRGSVTFSGSYVAGLVDNDFRASPAPTGRVKLAPYTVIDVAGQYRVTEGATLFATVRNALDADYQNVFGFETEGLTAFAGVRAEW